MSDIDLTDWIEQNNPSNGWQPIGVSSSAFKGIFDGNNHTISGLTINRPSTENVGFFGYIDAATIKNLTVKGNVEGGTHVGGICGAAGSVTFSNCNFTQGGSFGIKSHGNNSGGIAGYVTGQLIVSQCSCNATILGNGDNTGGLIGYANDAVTMSNNQVRGNIKGTGLYTGGIIGYILIYEQISLQKCIATGTVQGNDNVGGVVGGYQRSGYKKTSDEINKCSFVGKLKGANNVGGILGYSFFMNTWHPHYDEPSCSFTNSYAIVDIDATGDHIGGLIGKDEGYYDRWSVSNRYGDFTYVSICHYEISNSYSSGSISGKNYVGGLVGYKNRGSITKCFSNTSIYGTSHVGGIVGYGEGASDNSLTLKSNLSICNVVNASESNAGRVYGSVGSNVTIGANGSADENGALTTCKVSIAGVVQDISDNEQSGASQGASTLKYRANYVAKGWDFNNDWDIQETETYPYKPWQAAPPKIESDLVSQETTISGKSINGGKVYLQIGDNYRDSVECSGNHFSFDVPALQSGDLVRLYAVVDTMGQSLYTDAYVSYPGSGTETDPYRVYTAADLQGVYKKGYYKLMNDVDLTEWINENSPKNGWPAIGKNGLTAVYFDGGGHTVSGLWCNTAADYNGLFSNFPDGYIKNLNVKVAEGKEVKGGDCTGIVIGHFANGIIDNVTASGTVNGSKRCGGIVGVADNLKISSSKFDGILTSDSTNAILGGIVGEIQGGEITKSQASSTITAKGESTIAGALVGKNNASVSSSFTSGAVTLTGKNSYGGGLIGQNIDSASVENCYSTADATSTLYAAGLVAYNYGKVSNSYSKGNVNSEFYGAGAVGYNDGAKATVNNLVAGNPQVNVTDKSGWSIRVLGGFKNGASQPGENNYALSTMILSVNGVPKKVTDNILDGYAKTEDELKSKATYEKLSWSFSRVWKIEEGKAWPTLDMTVYGLVTSVTLDQKTLTLKKGQTATLKATVKPDDATNKTVAWSSSDTSIATVKDGVVRGVGNGKATIIATSTDGTNLSDSAIVTVYAPVNDTIVLKDTTTLKNKTIMYPVYLNNEDPVCSFQLDVYLPDGIDIAKNSKGKYDIQFAGRQEDTHSITSNKISTGAVRVIAFSIANDNFSGKSGALVNIPITIGDVAKGDYNISIRNIVLADASEKEYYCQDANGVIHVNDVIMGDANSDGKVSLADVNSTVNYIAEKPSENFYFAAADMNNNGIINVSDVNAIVNVLAEVKTSASAKKNILAAANEVTTNDKMYCSNITVAPGETATLPVNLDNSGKYCSFQFDILLPKGITVDSTVNQSGKVRYSASLVTSRCVDHSLTSNLIRGNRYRVIVFSLSNTDVEGANGPVVNIKLKAEKDAAEGDYTLKMERVVLATADEKEYYPADSESTVTVSANTGVNSISIDPSSVKVYDLQGRKVNKPTQGVYIVNGKKVVIK
ncbi:GLUG motif-containing protein [Hallella sp.]|uniref:GLUG motif-containing protein n=1 Tax=Hallella sp. TaxID=2980186 RepID=UPI002850C600|nr:GLUG motif-containing protein [Hallella sp.]MDR3845251.1 Ig-like domain-containing protein [Hallella sp.]